MEPGRDDAFLKRDVLALAIVSARYFLSCHCYHTLLGLDGIIHVWLKLQTGFNQPTCGGV